MSKFKIGDKARVLESYYDTIIKGDIIEVVEVHPAGVDVSPYGLYLSDSYITLDEPKEDKPTHYKTDSIDVIDFCKLYNLNFNCGNVVKYVARAGKKDCELTDLLKAKDYICREIKHLETIKNK